MPTLPEYNAPDQYTRLTPQTGGMRAAEEAGYREGRLYREGQESLEQGFHTIGEAGKEVATAYDDAQTQKEIIGGMKQAADLQASTTENWNQLRNTTDPSQLGAASHQFEQDFAAQQDKFLSNFTTRRAQAWGAEHFAQIYRDTLTRNRADVASAQGDAAVANLRGAVDQLGNMALRDPSMTSSAIDQYNHAIDALKANSPFLPREKWEEMRQEHTSQIAQAGVYGLAKSNPDAAVAALDSGKYDAYLTPKQGEELRSAIRAQTLAERADRRAARTDARDALVDTDRAAQTNIVSNLQVKPDGTIVYPPDFAKSVIDDVHAGRMLPTSGEAWLKKFQEGGAAADKDAQKQTFGDLAGKLTLPDTDPNHLTEGEVLSNVGGKSGLAPSQARFLLGLAQNKDPAAKPLIAAANTQITDTLNSGNDAPGAAAASRAKAFMWQQLEDGTNRGLSSRQMLDPQDKDNYIFKGGFDQFRATGNTAVAPVVLKSTAAVKPLSDAVDTAIQITDLMKYNSPEAVNDILHSRGVNIDATDGRWCAALVNTALSEAGLKGSGSELAASFKGWGFPVDAQHVQRNDVFYSTSGVGQGYSGHVGIATGQTRMGPHGLQVQVVSSHLEGSGANSGGVEWRDARGLSIRRATPTLAHITDAAAQKNGAAPAGSGPFTLKYWFGPPGAEREATPNE